jgi:CBS domain-containing protein
MAELTAREIMTENVITIKKDSSIEDLSEILLKNKISGVPVVGNDGKIAGVVTEGDIIVQDTDLHFPRYFKLLDGIIYLDSLNRFRDNLKKHLATKVEDIMVTKVKTISPDTTISDIAELMLRMKINRLPVVDEDDNILGIVTRADIVRSMIPKENK